MRQVHVPDTKTKVSTTAVSEELICSDPLQELECSILESGGFEVGRLSVGL